MLFSNKNVINYFETRVKNLTDKTGRSKHDFEFLRHEQYKMW